MKKCLLSILMTLLLQQAFAQDQIVKTNGDEVTGRVIEITLDEVRFQHPDSLDGIVWSIPKQEVFMVRFGNGTKEVFSENLADSTALNADALSPDESYQLGKNDARMYYKGSGAMWGSAACAIFAPYGLAGSIIIGAIPPKAHNHPVSDVQLLSDPYYVKGYQEQARRKKIGKAAAGAGIGTVTGLGIAIIIIISAFSAGP